MSGHCVWLTYFMDCIKKTSSLDLRLLQYEPIIPIKATPERRLSFLGFSMIWQPLPQPPLPRHFCFHAPQYRSTKQATKWGWLGMLLAKNAPVLWDTPEVSPNEATGVLTMLTRPWERWRLTQGSRTDVPWMPAVLLCDPTPLGGCQHHSGHSFWLEILPYCERLHRYERNIFIKRSIGNLLGKLWTCWMCMLQVILPPIYFLTSL